MPSRNIFTIGIAPPTAASKLSATPCFSASCASATPCLASSALFAVTTDFPAVSAVSIARLAGSPSPPINSTNTSISRSAASATGSPTQRGARAVKSRRLSGERAVTATASMGRPQRAVMRSRCRSIRRRTAEPTVPSPARPAFKGATMDRPHWARVLRLSHFLHANRCPLRLKMLQGQRRPSTPIRQRDDVVQLFRTGFKEAAQVAGGLADALLVLDQRDAHKPFPVLANSDARRNPYLGLLDKQGGKLDS